MGHSEGSRRIVIEWKVFALGAVCLIGAATAGGIKAEGMSLPVVDSVPRQVLLAVIGLSLIATSAFVRLPSSASEGGAGTSVPADPRYRRVLLQRVELIWIKDVLHESLYAVARLRLGLEERRDRVDRPWHLIARSQLGESRRLPASTSMFSFYKEVSGRLAILGQAGAGKTTVLLELARDLLELARTRTDEPVPVVLRLATWSRRHRALADWIVAELDELYAVPPEIGRDWIRRDAVALLLDGLDEVRSEDRAACVQAINTLSREHGLVPLVVSCRDTDYDRLPVKLRLHSAIVIQPLEREDIEALFRRAGAQLRGAHQAMRADPDLWHVVNSPLTLSIFCLTYQNRAVDALVTAGTVEERRARLFAEYCQRMLTRRTDPRYPSERVLRWLSWLAREQLMEGGGVLYADFIVLFGRGRRGSGVRLIEGLVELTSTVALSALLAGLAVALYGHNHGLLIGASVAALVVGLALLSPFVLRISYVLHIQRVDQQDRYGPQTAGAMSIEGWTLMILYSMGRTRFPTWRSYWLVGWLFSLRTWLLGPLSGMLIRDAEPRIAITTAITVLGFGAAMGLSFAAIGGLGLGIVHGLVSAGVCWVLLCALVERDLGLWAEAQRVALPARRLRHYTRGALLTSLAIATVLATVSELTLTLTGDGPGAMRYAALIGCLALLLGWCFLGGIAWLQHVAIRFWLFRLDLWPWHAHSFLAYAVDSLLLRKAGEGYLFVHDLIAQFLAERRTAQPL